MGTDFSLSDITHVDGVKWYEAPLPSRVHKCVAQTFGWTGGLNYVERCACGAIRLRPPDPWMERNSRRKDEKPLDTQEGSWLRRLARRAAKAGT